MDGILISEPVASLDGIVSVPPPIVFVHVTEGCVDTSLGGNSVRSGGEKFGNAGGFETLFDKTESSSESGTSSSDDNSVEGVINDGIFFKEGVL